LLNFPAVDAFDGHCQGLSDILALEDFANFRIGVV
jgi:hypothetical protein